MEKITGPGEKLNRRHLNDSEFPTNDNLKRCTQNLAGPKHGLICVNYQIQGKRENLVPRIQKVVLVVRIGHTM